MREIKFKAWDKEKKMWTNWKCYDNMFYFMDKNTGVWVRDDEFKRFILLQYTGLKDKNGVDIYEGDILKVRFYNPNRKDGPAVWYEYLKVVYYEELAQFVTLDKDDLDNYIFPERSMVIGNIYDNPELLEVGK